VFKQQMQQAISIHVSTHTYIKSVMSRVHEGKEIDVKKAKGFVTNLAENVVQNPTALMWLTQLKNKDEYTSIHSLNVCILALCFGRSIGLSKLQLVELGLGALLHDIGKLKVPLDILNKPDRLTSEEFAVMKKHTVFGYDLLKNKNELCIDSLSVIKNHHERLDGHGYPDKLPENHIGYYPKLVSIVDVYDAISSKRVYHEQITPYDSINYIYNQQRGLFDHKLVEQFIKYLGIYPIGSTVELGTGQVGIVMSFNDKSRLTPTVLLVLNENKKHYDKYKYINLAKAVLLPNGERSHIEGVVSPEKYGINVSDIMKRESLHLIEGMDNS
jgi:HD-GYP domain-containing protein (c-di-GMP phosphodiesterase class II)